MFMNNKNFERQLSVLFFWEGFPPCALLLVELKKKLGNNLTILATKANVNFPDFDSLYPNLNITWLNSADQIWEFKDLYQNYNIIVHTGWAHSKWLKFSRWMKKNNNSKIYLTVDNIFTGKFRQYLGAIYFRFKLKNIYDGVFVPGNDSKKYLEFLGMPSNKIFFGYYGAFEDIYFSNSVVHDRNEEFFFVGQLIYRKGLDTLLKAYKLYREQGGKWNLRISGSGPLEKLCTGEGIIFDKFLSPVECASKMRNSRCLILPSKDEHWGTVVCEAAACGMTLLLSNNIGSSIDLLRNGINGYSFETNSEIDLSKKMHSISNWDFDRTINASIISTSISKAFDSKSFCNGFLSMIEL